MLLFREVLLFRARKSLPGSPEESQAGVKEDLVLPPDPQMWLWCYCSEVGDLKDPHIPKGSQVLTIKAEPVRGTLVFHTVCEEVQGDQIPQGPCKEPEALLVYKLQASSDDQDIWQNPTTSSDALHTKEAN